MQLSVSFVHNKRLVRGLDYYNKTVFEFVSPLLGAQTAFCGGGRYDHLVSAVGGKQDQPSVGAAIGIDRLLMVLEAAQKIPVTQQQPLYIVIPLTTAQQLNALHMADHLLRKSYTVDMLCDGSFKSMMQKANKQGARAVLLIGEQEVIDGTVTLKDMISGEQKTIKQVDVASFLPH
jgi:histidyl-tRNA synthetase